MSYLHILIIVSTVWMARKHLRALTPIQMFPLYIFLRTPRGDLVSFRSFGLVWELHLFSTVQLFLLYTILWPPRGGRVHIEVFGAVLRLQLFTVSQAVLLVLIILDNSFERAILSIFP